jgi:hypothetical protein
VHPTYVLFANYHFPERISIAHFIEMIAVKTWTDPLRELEIAVLV